MTRQYRGSHPGTDKNRAALRQRHQGSTGTIPVCPLGERAGLDTTRGWCDIHSGSWQARCGYGLLSLGCHVAALGHGIMAAKHSVAIAAPIEFLIELSRDYADAAATAGITVKNTDSSTEGLNLPRALQRARHILWTFFPALAFTTALRHLESLANSE
jgi:hypothetical protein